MGQPYRSPAAPASEPGKKETRPEMADAELAIPMLLVSPIFLAVVIRTVLHGQTFGAGETMCGAMVLAAVALGVSAWRGRSA